MAETFWDRFIDPVKDTALVRWGQEVFKNMGLAQQQGQTGHTGSWGLPEFALGEAIAGDIVPTDYTGPGNPEAYKKINNPSSTTTTTTKKTPTTTNTGGGGGSSGIDLSNPVKRTEYANSLGYDSWDQYINANQQQAPQQPSFEDLYGDAFRQAFEAVNQMQGAIQSGYQAELSGAELGTQQRKAELQAEQAMRLADFARQRAEAQGQVGMANQKAEAQTESVIEQARRQAAELMQGIQARYGGTTGTGRFTSEILGSQATRNIAQNQAALRQYKAQMDSELQNTMSKIGLAENELKTKVTSLINQEDQNLQQAKIQLRANLDKSLAEISQQRSMLETEKANKRYEILNDYQNRLDQVERYNLDHKRQLEAQYQQQQNEINMLKQQAQQSYAVKTNELKTLTAPQLSQFVSGGILSPQQAFQQAQNIGYIDKDLKYQPTGEINPNNLYGNQKPFGAGDLNSQVEDILNAGGGGAG